jgi:hypothetical protein
MAYSKLKPHKMDEATRETELRKLWKETYCDLAKPIYTFDNILVKFYEDMFDHCFFESFDNIAKDKSILSLNRLEKLLWIKETLADTTSLLKQGWDKNKKKYVANRRVTLVKGNYIVIISINRLKTQARFITAYEIQNSDKVENIKNAPDWI